jgi:hypothetical protein
MNLDSGRQFPTMLIYLQRIAAMPKTKTHKGSRKRFRISVGRRVWRIVN